MSAEFDDGDFASLLLLSLSKCLSCFTRGAAGKNWANVALTPEPEPGGRDIVGKCLFYRFHLPPTIISRVGDGSRHHACVSM